VSTAHFSVEYDGSALDNHEMDSRDLAGALLALGDLMGDAASSLYGEGVKTNVKVRAFKAGSFGIDLSLQQSIMQSIVSILSTHPVEAASNASGMIALTFYLINFIKWCGKRKIRSFEAKSDNTLVVILEDGDSQELDERVVQLFQDLKTRKSLVKVLAPLGKSGIDSVKFLEESSGGVKVKISKDEHKYFDVPMQQDDLLLDEVRTMALSIISLAFKEENKWRLSDGNATIYAVIADQGFLRDVDENLISFSKGDVLMCRVRITQWQDMSGVRTDYTVEEVLEHKPGRKQMKLPFRYPEKDQ